MCGDAPLGHREAWRLLVLGGEVVPGTLGKTLGRPKSHQPVVDEAERGFGFHLLAAGHLKPDFKICEGVRT